MEESRRVVGGEYIGEGGRQVEEFVKTQRDSARAEGRLGVYEKSELLIRTLLATTDSL